MITTERLRLRPFVAGDLDEIHRLWTAPGVRRFLWDDEMITREQAQAAVEQSAALFEEKGYGLWAVSLRDEQQIIGFCGYWFFHEPPQLELLYGLAEDEWGKGLAAEAATAIIRHGFFKLGFDRITASTDAANLSSIRVMEKAGMRFERRENTNGLDTIYYVIDRD
ncbi:MAG TPA: GNAT family N-acetyltransferase [Blastocatellia bacterium]|nr:GNAT family N-acetyltransferase [Blastocatellia bacterium]